MMLYPAIDEIKKKTDSKYTLAILTAKRARDIIDGKPVLIDGADTENPVSEAASEIAEDLITYSLKSCCFVIRIRKKDPAILPAAGREGLR